MSAFIVENETIDKVVRWCGGGMGNFGNGNSVENQERFGRRLQELNYKAVCIRYPGEKIYKPIPYEWTGKQYNLYEVYKAICCLLYQMSEGEVVNSFEYKYLEQEKSGLAYRIISEHEQFKNAPWE